MFCKWLRSSSRDLSWYLENEPGWYYHGESHGIIIHWATGCRKCIFSNDMHYLAPDHSYVKKRLGTMLGRYCHCNVQNTTTFLSFPERFQLYGSGFFLIWIYGLSDIWHWLGCTLSQFTRLFWVWAVLVSYQWSFWNAKGVYSRFCGCVPP